ncbi:hypothetical protein THAOC_28456, partial [Thalassiosira oceanica]
LRIADFKADDGAEELHGRDISQPISFYSLMSDFIVRDRGRLAATGFSHSWPTTTAAMGGNELYLYNPEGEQQPHVHELLQVPTLPALRSKIHRARKEGDRQGALRRIPRNIVRGTSWALQKPEHFFVSNSAPLP